MQVEVTIKVLMDPADLAEHEEMANALAVMLADAPAGVKMRVALPVETPSAPPPAAAASPELPEPPAPAKRMRGGKVNGSAPVKAAAAPADPLEDLVEEPGDTGDAGVSDEELKERALAKLRLVWGKGGSDKVRALQKQFRFAKFADMPAERAGEVLAEANRLARELGLHV